MSQQFDAIYENGVLRPLQPVQLPEQTRVKVSVEETSSDITTSESASELGYPAGYFEATAGSFAGQPLDAEETKQCLRNRLALEDRPKTGI